MLVHSAKLLPRKNEKKSKISEKSDHRILNGMIVIAGGAAAMAALGIVIAHFGWK